MPWIPIRHCDRGLMPSLAVPLGRPPLTKRLPAPHVPSHVHGTPFLSGTSRLGPVWATGSGVQGWAET